ncbi:hypothetical protein [Fusobacterium sp. CAG:649]|uniref:hypothetical protein n=1 Tax=Fusobacterium sp. CAG:649 TaxID=1262900 RepID=UPI00033A1A88|nr:hypothetical protein [Fusobacterium sp. CAG:649]CDA09035.1 putative uncharacterized protein [Fusobacterium sp. CAG:649]
MIWNSISIKKIEDNDCEFFKKFSVKYSMVMFASLMKLNIFEKISLEELENYIKEKEKHSKIEMKEIEAFFLGIGLEIETSVLKEEREFSLKNIYNDQFKGKNILEIFEVISNIEEFISLFIIVEDSLLNFLNTKGKKTKKNFKIIENLFKLLEEENKKNKFLEKISDKTYLRNLENLEKLWDFLRKIRNLIAHSYGIMNEKNIKKINEMIGEIISMLDFPTLTLLSDMDSLLNPWEGIPERDDIINRPILKENYIIPFDSITCRFFRNFFIYFMESLNETFKS